jgi:serine/threonine protein kinase
VRCAAKELTGQKTLKREMETLSKLRHPNIIRLLHACTENDDLFILMELAELGSLDQAIQNHPGITQSRYFSLLHGVVLGMKVLHAHNKLHNDLKPANILVSKDWIAKLADFGSATGANGATSGTTGGAGTLKYQAPEIVNYSDAPQEERNKHLTMKSDVYSFGMTMYEAVTGIKPWPGATQTAIVANVISRKRPSFPYNFHPFFRETIESCWKHNPGDRPLFGAIAKQFEEARVKYPEFREDQASALYVVISSPGKTLDGEEVMQMVEALCKIRTDLLFGYDWEGSTSKDERDDVIDWSNPRSVELSFWFKGYCERTKGLITALVQQGHALELICIEGGPISQLEAVNMEKIRNEVLQDLQSKGVTGASITAHTYSFDDFKGKFGGRTNTDKPPAGQQKAMPPTGGNVSEPAAYTGGQQAMPLPTDADPTTGGKFTLTPLSSTGGSGDDAPVPSTVKLVKEIAKGGFGTVHQGVYNDLPCAVKLIKEGIDLDLANARQQAELKALHAEIELMRKFEHPNIVKFLTSYTTDDGFPAVVMELCSGGSYWERLQSLRKEELEVRFFTCDFVKVLREAACGMVYLHSCQPPVIHRDLKAANILLDGNDTAKVADFGISRLQETTDVSKTKNGSTGTLHYMAPELLTNESHYTEKVDVYAFSMVIYETLTCEYPFKGMTPAAILNRIKEEIRPELPADVLAQLESLPRASRLHTLMERCWNQTATKRPSFEEVHRELQEIESLP